MKGKFHLWHGLLDFENRQKVAKEMKTFIINTDTTEPMIKATMLKQKLNVKQGKGHCKAVAIQIGFFP